MISEMEIQKLNNTMGTVFLDPEQKSPRAQDFEQRLSDRIVGHRVARISSATDRCHGRKSLRIFERQAPRAKTAHAQASQIDAVSVDLVSLNDIIQQGH